MAVAASEISVEIETTSIEISEGTLILLDVASFVLISRTRSVVIKTYYV